MTRDIIAVEREYEGERCGEHCRQAEERFYVIWCHAFHSALDKNSDEPPKRHPRCLAQPPAVLLTPEQVNVLRYVARYMLEEGDSEDGNYHAPEAVMLMDAFDPAFPAGWFDMQTLCSPPALLTPQMREAVTGMVEALEMVKREFAHEAPRDCWATGPYTGNVIADHVVCPGCATMAKVDAALAAAKGEG